jgi:arylsulfatase A-like enzyme
MKKHRFAAALFCVSVFVWLVPAHAAENNSRPNVVIFLADDLGYGDVGCHGNPYVQTPQIDAFAREAVEFKQFYVSPVCAPTRASLMTGRYNFRTGVADVFGDASQMDLKEVTIAEALRDAGYATGIFGKWHLGRDLEHGPNAQGFEESLVHPGAAMRSYFDPSLIHNGTNEIRKGYCMDIFTDAALGFIRQNRARPFFVYLAANLIHTPLQVADELEAPFKAKGLDGKTAKICGMIQSLDASFGRVRAALKELGLEDNTLVIFFSDNGPCSGSITTNRFMAGLHGLKGTPYENGIRVPCFARWPKGFKSPAQIDRIAAHIDVMPTVLAACGVKPPKGVAWDGVNLLPLLRKPSAKWPDRNLFFQWDSGQVPRRGHAFAVRNQRYKLVQPTGMDSPGQKHILDRCAELCAAQGRKVRTMDGPPQYELYDIASDPGEWKDIASDHPKIVRRMRNAYDDWFTNVTARWGTKR